jgi:homoserine O-acetyltransferase
MSETKYAAVGDLPLQRGGTLRDAKLAYVTYGTLAPGGRNAVLLTHGYTSSHLFADGGAAASEGSWAGLVGPGKAIDTDRFFVVSSNMLGSAFGSTAPSSINPATGIEYGPDFPTITLRDIVTAQKRMLDGLGVQELVAVVGPSYGGFQAFAWGIEFPGFMRGLVPVVTGLKPPGTDADALMRRLATDPNWNGGHYYRVGGILRTMTAIREETLRRYGAAEALAAKFPEATAIAAEITRQAREWSAAFDGHSLVILARALNHYDATPDVGRIRAKVLYVLSRTDALFPPSLKDSVMPALFAAGVDARYVEIDSDHGHLASGADWQKWAPALRDFMRELAG